MPPTHTIQVDRPIAGVRVVSDGEGPVSDRSADSVAVPEEIERIRRTGQALQAAGEELHRMRRQLLAGAEEQLLDLAVQIARKIIQQEVQTGRVDVEPIVRNALARVSAAGEVMVRLNAGDLARLVQAGGGEEDTAGSQHVRFVPDPNVRPGECVVETAESVVEATVEGQLAAAREALAAAGEMGMQDGKSQIPNLKSEIRLSPSGPAAGERAMEQES